ADHGHAAGMPDHVDRGGQIQQRLVPGNLQAVAAAFLGVLLGVTELDATPDAIEQAGRDRQVTVGRVTVRDAADVMVHAEDFLRDHQRATHCTLRRREPGIEFVPVTGHERGELTHEAAPERSAGKSRRQERIVPLPEPRASPPKVLLFVKMARQEKPMKPAFIACLFLCIASGPAAAAEDLAKLADEVRATEIAFAKTLADRDAQAFRRMIAPDVVWFADKPLRGPD